MSTRAIFEVHEAHYDWCWFAVYQHPTHTGRFATFQQTGCSCDAAEPPVEEDIRAAEPVDRATARIELTKFMDWHKSFVDKGAAVRYLERFEIATSEPNP